MGFNVENGKQQVIKHIVTNYHLPKPHRGSSFLVFADASVSQPDQIAKDIEDSVIGLGWVVCSREGDILCEGSDSVTGDYCINRAEAEAIRRAIHQMKAMDWFDSGVTVYVDNTSVVETFERDTKLRSYDVFKELLKDLAPDQIKTIKRDHNTVADKLSNDRRKELI